MDVFSSLIYSGFVWKYLLGKLSDIINNNDEKTDCQSLFHQIPILKSEIKIKNNPPKHTPKL